MMVVRDDGREGGMVVRERAADDSRFHALLDVTRNTHAMTLHPERTGDNNMCDEARSTLTRTRIHAPHLQLDLVGPLEGLPLNHLLQRLPAVGHQGGHLGHALLSVSERPSGSLDPAAKSAEDR